MTMKTDEGKRLDHTTTLFPDSADVITVEIEVRKHWAL
jgi:hypothetical protein